MRHSVQVCDDWEHVDLTKFDSKVDLILTDPPFGVLHRAHDVAPDYVNVLTTTARLLKPGGNALLFCSLEQVSLWKQASFGLPLMSGLDLKASFLSLKVTFPK